MDHFQRREGWLCAEDVRLDTVASTFGTPTYVYSRATLARHVQVLQAGLADLDHLICYAIKANGNLAILELLSSLGCGLDAVSGGELCRALKAGAAPNRVILSGVGKTDAEISAALRAGVLYVCVESAQELQAVARLAREMGVKASVAVRVNPDVNAHTHPYISTGLKENKFGVPIGEAPALYAQGNADPSLQMVGVTCHIGSQITQLSPFTDAAERMARLCAALREQGAPLQHVGMGGGLGVPYHGEQPPDPATYGAALARVLGPLKLKLVLEPGRVLVGNAGVLLTRVVRTKRGADRDFVIVDAGMNDLLRPALYEAYHGVEPVAPNNQASRVVDVVGPVCESADTFAKQRALPAVEAGDLLAIRTAGAYGMAMASNYNARPRPAEVLCVDGEARLIRAREEVSDLWRGERHLDGRVADSTIPGA